MTVFSTHIHIPAPAALAWDILANNVQAWPDWTQSMTSIRALDPGPMRNGARFAVKQPKLPEAVMTVVDWEPISRFSWRSEGRLLWAMADHAITPVEDKGCTLVLRLTFHGPLSGIAGRWMASLVQRYLQMEAEGLRAECLRQSAGQPRPSQHPATGTENAQVSA